MHQSNRHSEILQGQESEKSLSKETLSKKDTDLGRSASHVVVDKENCDEADFEKTQA